ncbi:MAG: alpha/beta fold hydrolase [Wenzhouxiangella sp.]|nr:alpha/beta fold hydrolase [Wenzhouxiangella sp.]MCH8476641.1 alpha/beta hydrolase [Wenzhouxiangella sp.]
MSKRVIFSHGHLSSPESRKIQVLAPLAQARGYAVEAIDYRDLRDDPVGRIDRLAERLASLDEPPVLVGSSMGGIVSMAAAEQHPVDGLFLLAPALYLEDRLPDTRVREAYQPQCRHIALVHGWHDDVIPWQHSLRFAEVSNAALHLVHAGHQLGDCLPTIAALFEDFLARCPAPCKSTGRCGLP